MSTFAQVRARVQSYLLDVPTALLSEIPAMVNAVIRRAQEKHNFRVMETTFADQVTTKEVRKLANKPTDWKESRGDPWYKDVKGSLYQMEWAPSLQDAVRAYDDYPTVDKGYPMHLLEQDTEFWVYPYPDGLSDHPGGEYRITIPYWKFLAALSADSDSNWFTTNAEDFVVYGAVGEGFAFNFDETRHQFWGLTYDQRTMRPLGKAAVELYRLTRKDRLSKLTRGLTLHPRRDVRQPFIRR